MGFSKEDLEEFKPEAYEILDTAEKKLFAIEANEDFRSSFDIVFRALHNLKGASGMLELTVLQAHVHELETVLMGFKEKVSMPKEYISFFLRGIDAARSILEGNEIQFDYQVSVSNTPVPTSTPETKSEKPSAIDLAGLQEYVSESHDILERLNKKVREIESNSFETTVFNEIYRDVHSLKGGAFLFSLNHIGEVAHALESCMEPLRENKSSPSRDFINLFYQTLTLFESELTHIGKGSVSPLNPEKVKSIVNAWTNVMKMLPSMNSKKESIAPTQTPTASKQKETQAEKETDSSSTIRVPVSLLDNLMTLMGEMVLVRNQVIQFSNKSEDLDFLNLSKRLNVVTTEIQGEMMKTRMQPIGNVLTKYHRVVRDLSQDLQKSITLTLHGAETELDKSLLEAIKDPLTHIVRNSCDHGIETPAIRKQAGKPEQGNIQIRSYHEGGQVIIEVSDDGKGLNRDALLKKGIEAGIVNPSQANTITDAEIYNLIFAPGLSTAAVVTNVSGRGVGMDVVRTNIEKIGGSIELASRPGNGTTTKIKIPLTLAIIPALIVKSGIEAFAIPQVKLDELIRIDQSQEGNRIEFLHGAPVYRLRGNILPLVDLQQILGGPAREYANDQILNVAVLHSDHSSFGLIIDEVHDTADIVVKPLNRLLRSLQIYSGATILGDGSIALILDVPGLAKVGHVGKNIESKTDHDKNKHHQTDLQEYLIVGVNSPTKHAIVLGYVHRLEEFKRSKVEYAGKHPVIRYGNTILPLLSVSEQLGYGRRDTSHSDTLSVVVVMKGGVLYGLEVDEIIDTLSSNCEVEPSLSSQPGFFGNMNTSEGLIVTIDPFELIRLAFPIKENAAGKIQTAHSVHHKNAKKELNILLVEDTVFFRKAVEIILVKEGHHVTIAVDGKEAYDLLEKNHDHYDLVISDIEMPKMNGFELAKAIRANQKFAHLPLLALSSRADRTYCERGLQAGFNSYLEKLKPNVLLEAISELNISERKVAS